MYKRIRELREDGDILQKQIAAYLNCTQQAYSAYEVGSRDVPVSMLIKIADFYGVSVDYVLGRTDNKNLYH